MRGMGAQRDNSEPPSTSKRNGMVHAVAQPAEDACSFIGKEAATQQLWTR